LENIPGGSHPGYIHLLVGTLTKFTEWVLVYDCGSHPGYIHLLVGTLTKFTEWVLVYDCGSPKIYENVKEPAREKAVL